MANVARFCIPEDLPNGREKNHGGRELFYNYDDDIEVREGSGAECWMGQMSNEFCAREGCGPRPEGRDRGSVKAEDFLNAYKLENP